MSEWLLNTASVPFVIGPKPFTKITEPTWVVPKSDYDALAEQLQVAVEENARLREVAQLALATLGANHVVEQGPNARWVEFEDRGDGPSGDGYFEEDLVPTADCPVCATKRAIEAALTALGESQEEM